MSEEITLVDINDHITGYGTKAAVHEKGILHRAFSVFIVNGDKMLLQKRNPDKYHSGGLWSNACCSHQRKNEVLSEAVHRRMREELGFDCELSEAFRFIYRTRFDNGLTEYELDHVFTGAYEGNVRFDPQEIAEVRWIAFDALKREMLDRPEDFSSWFIISAPRVMEMLEEEMHEEADQLP